LEAGLASYSGHTIVRGAGERHGAPRPPRVVILGAGPAGICAASALGPDGVVLEQRGEIGGLTCSFEFHGVTFDLGGHSFHSPHAAIRDLVFDSVEMYEQKREARCFAAGALIPYPFQKHFRELRDPKLIEECERGLLGAAAGGADPENLEAYLYDRFGSGIAEHFLLPYNRKLWGPDLRQISTDWVGERIAKPSGTRECFETRGGRRKPLQDDTTVAYPARGGFGEITLALAKKIGNLRLGTQAKQIDWRHRKLVTAAGDVVPWQRLISTLPLNRLLDVTKNVPAELRLEAARLRHIAMKLVWVVIDAPVETAIQRVYNVDAGMVAHKVGIANNSSAFLRGLPRTGIFGEVAYDSATEVKTDGLADRFVRNLLEIRLIKDARKVLATAVTDLSYAYPAPTIERSTIVAKIKAWLEDRGIYSIGRFGEWAYINSDEAMFRGLAIGRRLAAEL